MNGLISPQLDLIIPYYSPILGINFRLALVEDLQNLRANCYPESDWEQFQDHYRYLLNWQENGRCYILIAETAVYSPEIIGSGQLIRKADTAEIAELVVRAMYRNRGIGTAMIHILTQIAQVKKTSMLEIGAAIENQAALRLYRRLGFGGDRMMRLPDAQEAIILKKNLT